LHFFNDLFDVREGEVFAVAEGGAKNW